MPRKELARLVKGFRRFREKFYVGDDPTYARLANGWQGPKTLVIGCCDSRVDPAILSSASPGELFVVRNVANLVPPCESDGGHHGVSAAIEFAVLNLKVENIIVLGHRQCGGIHSLLFADEANHNSFVHQWVQMAEPAKARAIAATKSKNPNELWKRCELESIRTSIENLRTFPFVKNAININKKDLSLLGIYFDIETGDLLELIEETGEFRPLLI